MGTEMACSSHLVLGLSVGTLLWMEGVHRLTRVLVIQAFGLVSAVLRGMRSHCLRINFRSVGVLLGELVWWTSLRNVPKHHTGGFCETAWSEFGGVTCLRSCFISLDSCGLCGNGVFLISVVSASRCGGRLWRTRNSTV